MKLRLAVLILLLASAPAGFASRRAQRARGAAVFTATGCAHCHSIRGVGGRKGPELSGVGRRMNKARLRQQIMDGSKLMPPFGEDLNSTQLNDLLAYLRSCRDRKKQ